MNESGRHNVPELKVHMGEGKSIFPIVIRIANKSADYCTISSSAPNRGRVAICQVSTPQWMTQLEPRPPKSRLKVASKEASASKRSVLRLAGFISHLRCVIVPRQATVYSRLGIDRQATTTRLHSAKIFIHDAIPSVSTGCACQHGLARKIDVSLLQVNGGSTSAKDKHCGVMGVYILRSWVLRTLTLVYSIQLSKVGACRGGGNVDAMRSECKGLSAFGLIARAPDLVSSM